MLGRRELLGALIVAMTGLSGGLLQHQIARPYCTYFPQDNIFTALGCAAFAATMLLTASWLREFIFTSR